MDDYAKLKLLLLEEERHKIDELEALLEKSIQENSDANAIVKKISPLLSDIFSKTIEENKAEFVSIFAPLISDMLESTINDSGDKIAEVMSPIISLAIKNQVKNEKDDIVDALYPVIGNMISKYVSQSFKDMIDEINTKVQSTLSYETFKRKIMAKLKGVSETELLLQSSKKLNKIESVFLIHKESGILVSERSLKNHEAIEPEMVASMLSAIRSFVNDWISKNSDNLELNEIEFGNYTIYLEVAGCCYLAVVLSGTSNRLLQDKITSVLEFLVKKHSDAIVNFDGDRSRLNLEEINAKLDTLLQESEKITEEKEAKNYVAIWLFAFVLLVGIGTTLYLKYSNSSLEKEIEHTLLQNPRLNLYAIEVEVSYSSVKVEGKLPYESLHLALIESIQPLLTRRVLEDKIVLSYAPLTNEEIEKQLQIAVESLNTLEGNRISYSMKEERVTLHGVIENRESYEKFLETLSSIAGIKNIISDVDYNFEKKALTLYYDVAKSSLSLEKKELLDLWMKTSRVDEILSLYKGLNLIVLGFSDAKGSVVRNVKYAQLRAKNVYEYLVENGIDPTRVNYVASPSPLKGSHNENREEGRLVKIQWIKNDN